MPIGAARSNTVGKKFEYSLDRYAQVNTLYSNTPFLYVYDDASGEYKQQGLDTSVGTVFPETPYNSSLGGSEQAIAVDTSGNKWWAVRDSGSKAFIYKMSSGSTNWTYITTINHGGSTTYSAAWNNNATILIFGTSSGSRLHGYSRSGNTFTKDQTFNILPTSTVYDVAFSPNGQYIGVAWNSSTPYVYYLNQGTWTRYNAFYAAPDGSGSFLTTRGYSVGFNYQSNMVAFGHYGTPYVRTYTLGFSQQGYTLYAHSNPSTAAANRVYGLTWHPSENRFITGTYRSPYLQHFTASSYTTTYGGAVSGATDRTYNAAWVRGGDYLVAPMDNTATIKSWEYFNGNFFAIDTELVSGATAYKVAAAPSDDTIEVSINKFPYHQGYTINSAGNFTAMASPLLAPTPADSGYNSATLAHPDKILISSNRSTLSPTEMFRWNNSVADYTQLFSNGDDINFIRITPDQKYAIGFSASGTIEVAELTTTGITANANLVGGTTSISFFGDPNTLISGDSKHFVIAPAGFQAPYQHSLFFDWDDAQQKYIGQGFPSGYPTQGSEYGADFNYTGDVFAHANYTNGIDIYKRSGTTWSYYGNISASDIGQQQWSFAFLMNPKGNVIYINVYGTWKACVDNGNGTFTITNMTGSAPTPVSGSSDISAIISPDGGYMWVFSSNQWHKCKLVSDTAFDTSYESYDIDDAIITPLFKTYGRYDGTEHWKKV